jgi:hypothetical protein
VVGKKVGNFGDGVAKVGDIVGAVVYVGAMREGVAAVLYTLKSSTGERRSCGSDGATMLVC